MNETYHMWWFITDAMAGAVLVGLDGGDRVRGAVGPRARRRRRQRRRRQLLLQ